MQTGRPPKYDTPEQMQEAIDAYFERCVDEELVPTVTGLALALGFSGRSDLIYYKDEKDGFYYTVKKARTRIEAALEQALVSRASSVTGLIFNLKNNFGWKDAQELTHVTENEEGEREPLRFV